MNIDWAQLITAGGILYGAGLGTAELLHRRREKSPQVVVGAAIGVIPGDPYMMPRLILTARNQGTFAINLSDSGIVVPDRPWRYLPGIVPSRFSRVFPWDAITPDKRLAFPYKLEPSDSAQDRMNMAQVTGQLEEHGYTGRLKFYGMFIDRAGRSYYSRAITIDLSQWEPFLTGSPREGLPIVAVIQRLPNSAPVFAANGQQVGTVRDTSDEFFFLDRGGGVPALQIPNQWVERVTENAVHLVVNADALHWTIGSANAQG